LLSDEVKVGLDGIHHLNSHSALSNPNSIRVPSRSNAATFVELVEFKLTACKQEAVDPSDESHWREVTGVSERAN
jgi:hypothetical protein